MKEGAPPANVQMIQAVQALAAACEDGPLDFPSLLKRTGLKEVELRAVIRSKNFCQLMEDQIRSRLARTLSQAVGVVEECMAQQGPDGKPNSPTVRLQASRVGIELYSKVAAATKDHDRTAAADELFQLLKDMRDKPRIHVTDPLADP